MRRSGSGQPGSADKQNAGDRCESSPTAQAYLEGWRAGLGGKPKKYPPNVNTPELRANFDEGYEDGTTERHEKENNHDQ